MVKFETSLGDFVIALDAAKAPVTVANFLQYVDDGHFDGTVFHRVIPGFVIQGGGMTADAAVRGIRELDEEGNVGVVTEESDEVLRALAHVSLLGHAIWFPDDHAAIRARVVDIAGVTLGAAAPRTST